jgi:hypothetical protein
MKYRQLGCFLTRALIGASLLAAGCKDRPASTAAGDANAGSDASLESSTATPATALPAASVEAFMNPQRLPLYEGPTGSIEGTVTIAGDSSPDTLNRNYTKCPEGERAYKRLFREGPARPDGSRPVADALVAVTGYTGAYIAEKKAARVVTIEDCAFSSRTIDMTIGQRLEIRNNTKDKIFAPAFLQAPSPLALVATPHGDPVNLYPQAPHIYTLYDRFGAGAEYMTGEVYVLVQPLHTITDLEGHYRIDGVPVGKVKVNALLGVIKKEASKGLEVRAGEIQSVDLELSYSKPPPLPTLRPNADDTERVDAGRPNKSRPDNLYK